MIDPEQHRKRDPHVPRARPLDRRDPAVWAWLAVALIGLLALLPLRPAFAAGPVVQVFSTTLFSLPLANSGP